MRVVPILVALTLTAPSALAAVESYRSVMPNGSVRYGEAPEWGAKAVRKMPAAPASTGTIIVSDEEKQKVRQPVVERGVSVVLPPTTRESPHPAPAGHLQAPAALPKRAPGY
jgi:hypothetical protein